MTDTGFRYSGNELESFRQARHYFAWIMELFGARVRGRVLEIGAGLGTTAEWLLLQPGTRELVLLEPADNLFQALQERFAQRRRVRTVQGYFDSVELPGAFDAIVLVNVLEHIEDDAALVRRAFEHLSPGGALLLFVPAMQALYGSLDAEFEHHRRYGRGALQQLLCDAGFHIERLRFVHAIGVLGWLIAGKILRRRTISPTVMRTYDRHVIPWVRRIESHLQPPFGQSLLAIAVRPER